MIRKFMVFFVFVFGIVSTQVAVAGVFKKAVLLTGAAAAGKAYAVHKQKKEERKLKEKQQ